MDTVTRLQGDAITKHTLLVTTLLLLILQSFDWLAAFHLEWLQAILFTAV
jgi:hypothetical protein